MTMIVTNTSGDVMILLGCPSTPISCCTVNTQAIASDISTAPTLSMTCPHHVYVIPEMNGLVRSIAAYKAAIDST